MYNLAGAFSKQQKEKKRERESRDTRHTTRTQKSAELRGAPHVSFFFCARSWVVGLSLPSEWKFNRLLTLICNFIYPLERCRLLPNPPFVSRQPPPVTTSDKVMEVTTAGGKTESPKHLLRGHLLLQQLLRDLLYSQGLWKCLVRAALVARRNHATEIEERGRTPARMHPAAMRLPNLL